MSQDLLVKYPLGGHCLTCETEEYIQMPFCLTYFKDFDIFATIKSNVLKPVEVNLSMMDRFNALPSGQKTIVKNWEKTKIADLFNLFYEEILGAGNYTPLTYSDIPDSFFS